MRALWETQHVHTYAKYVCMFVCMYVCKYVCMMYVRRYVRAYVCMYACMLINVCERHIDRNAKVLHTGAHFLIKEQSTKFSECPARERDCLQNFWDAPHGNAILNEKR